MIKLSWKCPKCGSLAYDQRVLEEYDYRAFNICISCGYKEEVKSGEKEKIRSELDRLLSKLPDKEQKKWLLEKQQERMYRHV